MEGLNRSIQHYFPPYPSKRCMSLSQKGTLTYGHKNTVIHLLSLKEAIQVFKGNSRVNALEWSPEESDARLALGFEDGHLLLLNYEFKLIGRHEGHGSNGIMNLSWGHGSILYSLDLNGSVVSYTPQLNYIQIYKPLSSQCKGHLIQAHPQKPDIYVIAASKFIYVIHKAKVIKFLKHHEIDITSLVWGESLLASATCREILIWDPLVSNHFTHKLYLNHHSRIKKEVHLSWPSKDVFISSSNNQLLQWDLSTKKSSVLHSLHGPESNVISLVSRKSKTTNILSFASDNNLISYEIESKTHKFTLPTISLGVYSILPNPIEGSTLAIGGGDGKLRIWNSHVSSEGVLDVQTFWRKLKMMKIISLAWHPDKEGVIGLGMQEGHVCVIDITSRNPEPSMYEYKHKGPVYKIFWAPLKMWNSTSNEHVLYSAGDGLIVMHETKSTSVVLSNCEESPFYAKNDNKDSPSYSDLECKPLQGKDNEEVTFALGHLDGTVSVLSKDRTIALLKYHQKLVYCVSWHPLYYNDDDISKYSNWLAASTNEENISIWNLDFAFSETSTENTFLTKPTVILKGHNAKVVKVIWSPHDEAKLLSISYDLSAQIWNAIKGEPLANFRGHTKRLLCASWSMTDPNVIYTGADDSTLYTWKISELEHKVPPVLKKTKKSNTKWDISPATYEDDESREKSNVFESNNPKQPSNSNTKTLKQKNYEKSFFPLCNKDESESFIHEDALILDKLNISDNNKGSTSAQSILEKKPHLKYFIPSVIDDETFASDEVSNILSSGEYETAATLGLWVSADLGTIVRKAMSNGRLNDWLVSLAASAGQQLWIEACESYAEQLIKIQSDYLKASSYFLMGQNPLKAVQVLLDGKYFRSAVSLIKGRLNSNEELLRKVYISWAQLTSCDGRYELATRCWIAAGESVTAASTLAKIKDSPECLEVAGILYHRHGELEKAEILGVQAASSFIEKGDWKSLNNLIDWGKDLSTIKCYFSLLVSAKNLLDESMASLQVLWSEESIPNNNQKGLIIILQESIFTDLKGPEDYEELYSSFKSQCVVSSKVSYIEEIVMCALSVHSKERSILHLVKSIEKSLDFGAEFAAKLIHAFLLSNGNSDPPNVGICLWNEPLAWQCRWKELESLQCYTSYVKLRYFNEHVNLCDADIVEDISFNLMREDVINSQKLLYDIEEADEAMKMFDNEEENVIKTEPEEERDEVEELVLPNMKALSLKEPDHCTPHGGNSTQTMELTSEGNWKTVLASDIPPPSGTDMPDMPPPMGLTKSFKERFLYDNCESTKINALKEIQKLKWEQSRTNVLTCPYPDITEALKDILKLLEGVKKNLGDPKGMVECRIKDIATWAYWKGATKDQKYFMELT
uniref:Gem (Nuclear organelle) associated protein 5 [Orcinus orca] n=1 Tax=Lepeophtheirus salmonis TaxID=72036 RepID=A0A0K2ULA9_LEPSM